MRVCVCACVRACLRVCVRACVRACVWCVIVAFSDPCVYNVFVVGSFAILCPDGYGYVKQPVGELMKGKLGVLRLYVIPAINPCDEQPKEAYFYSKFTYCGADV